MKKRKPPPSTPHNFRYKGLPHGNHSPFCSLSNDRQRRRNMKTVSKMFFEIVNIYIKKNTITNTKVACIRRCAYLFLSGSGPARLQL